MRRHCLTQWLTRKLRGGAETLGDKLIVAQEVVETLAELHQHWPTLADSQAKMEAKTPFDTLSAA